MPVERLWSCSCLIQVCPNPNQIARRSAYQARDNELVAYVGRARALNTAGRPCASVWRNIRLIEQWKFRDMLVGKCMGSEYLQARLGVPALIVRVDGKQRFPSLHAVADLVMDHETN